MSDKRTWPIKNADKGQYETVDILEAVAQRCSVKKVILEISQNSRKFHKIHLKISKIG